MGTQVDSHIGDTTLPVAIYIKCDRLRDYSLIKLDLKLTTTFR